MNEKPIFYRLYRVIMIICFARVDMKKLEELLKKHKEILMYVIFGLATTFVSLLVYSLCVGFAGITLASGISWVISVSFAFVTNKIFVFESKDRGTKTIFREAIYFFAARGLSGVVEIFLPELLFTIGLEFSLFGVEGLVAKIIVNVIVIIMNYIFSKLWVFRKSR